MTDADTSHKNTWPDFYHQAPDKYRLEVRRTAERIQTGHLESAWFTHCGRCQHETPPIQKKIPGGTAPPKYCPDCGKTEAILEKMDPEQVLSE